MSGLFDFVLITADLRASEESSDVKTSIIGRILERTVALWPISVHRFEYREAALGRKISLMGSGAAERDLLVSFPLSACRILPKFRSASDAGPTSPSAKMTG
jgi:hypothetical protein